MNATHFRRSKQEVLGSDSVLCLFSLLFRFFHPLQTQAAEYTLQNSVTVITTPFVFIPQHGKSDPPILSNDSIYALLLHQPLRRHARSGQRAKRRCEIAEVQFLTTCDRRTGDCWLSGWFS